MLKPTSSNLSSVRLLCLTWRLKAAHRVKQNRVSSRERRSIRVNCHHLADWADGLVDASQSCPNQSRCLIWFLGSESRVKSRRGPSGRSDERTFGSNGGWRRLQKEPRSRLRKRPPPLASTMPSRKPSLSRLKSSVRPDGPIASSSKDCRILSTSRNIRRL